MGFMSDLDCALRGEETMLEAYLNGYGKILDKDKSELAFFVWVRENREILQGKTAGEIIKIYEGRE